MTFNIGQKIIYLGNKENISFEVSPTLKDADYINKYKQIKITNPIDILESQGIYTISDIERYKYIPDLIKLQGIKGKFNSKYFKDYYEYMNYIKQSKLNEEGKIGLLSKAKQSLDDLITGCQKTSNKKLDVISKTLIFEIARKNYFRLIDPTTMSLCKESGNNIIEYILLWYNDCITMKVEYTDEDGKVLGIVEYSIMNWSES